MHVKHIANSFSTHSFVHTRKKEIKFHRCSLSKAKKNEDSVCRVQKILCLNKSRIVLHSYQELIERLRLDEMLSFNHSMHSTHHQRIYQQRSR